MTWNVVHNYPGAKDTYEVPVDYPTVGYDTIIAVWFTDVFTSILAMQESLIGATAIFLLKAGGTMTGDLTILKKKILLDNTGGEDAEPALVIKSSTGSQRVEILENGNFVFGVSPHQVVFEDGDLSMKNLHVIGSDPHGNITVAGAVDGIKISLPVWSVDIEVSDKTKGLILKSPNDSRFRLEVSDGGVLSTEAL